MNVFYRIIGYIVFASVLGIFMVRSVQDKYSPQPLSREKTEWLQWNYADFSRNNENLDRYVEELIKKFSDEEIAGMLLMPALEKDTDFSEFLTLFEKYHLGGYMILGRELSQREEQVLQEKVTHHLPLLRAVDAEPSLLKYRLPGLAFLHETRDLKTHEQVQSEAARIARYLKKNSVNINFAPVYDVGINDEVIGKRAFSKENVQARKRAQWFADEMLLQNIFPTAKHFPGHGNVVGDTHKKLAHIDGPLQELDNFVYAIEEGVPMIMVGHLAIDHNEKWGTQGKPATLSAKIMTDLLREKLGFKGIIITDAMNMGALRGFEHGERRALQAGADIVLMPRNIDEAYHDILFEMKTNPDFKRKIIQKAKHILRMRVVIRNSKYFMQ